MFVFRDNREDNISFPIYHAIADSYKYAYTSINYLDDFYKNVINEPYFREKKYLCELRDKHRINGGQWVAECCEKPMFVYAPLRSQRQASQSGRYILFPNKITGKSIQLYFTPEIEKMNKEDDSIIERFIISKDGKNDIINNLKIFGISERTLFPDNKYIVCKQIFDEIKMKSI